MKRPVYFLVKCQAGVFAFSTVFINPDIYWGRMIRVEAPIWPEWLQTSHGEDLKAAGACLTDFLAIRGQYMSEFIKTVSKLKQNFLACLLALAGRQASPLLQMPGGYRQRGLEEIA